ncbi:MAG: YfiR family protein [Bacteroidota bacterium]
MACFLLTAGNFTPAIAQGKPPLEYQVKAAFLFNFTRFVHWPASSFASADAPFVIGIAGNDPFGTYLDDMVADEKVDGHRIIVRRYADGQELSGCHLLFINNNDPAKLSACLSLVVHQNVLTVGDNDNFIKAGGILRFYKDENRIKMEIRLAAAKVAQLEISAKLLQVAKVN